MLSSSQILSLKKKYNKILLANSLRLTKNPTDAEDLMQDTWIKIAINIDEDKPDNFISWAVRIMTNTFLDHQRKTNAVRRIKAQSLDSLQKDIVDPVNDIQTVDSKESLTGLLSLLNQHLQPNQYDLLKLAYVDDMTAQAIMDSLKYQNVKQVYNELRRARENAKRVIINNSH